MKKAVLLLILLSCGFILGKAYGNYDSQKNVGYFENRENSSAFSFINPLLECSIGSEYLSSETRPTKAKLNELVKKETEAGHISFASVYFRDLNNGPWLGINERENFFPSSLMKVPLMMYFYKQAEDNPRILETVVSPDKISGTLYSNPYFKPSVTIDSKVPHTVGSLVESAIRHSDNNAAEALLHTASVDGLRSMLGDLHLEAPQNDDYINVKDYSSFFRVLFNASYLSQKNSEKALKLLSQTDFDMGIVKYLPKEIVVAHKFGEKPPVAGELGQLHDCGVVYVPKHPYLVCIMTRGKSMDDLAETIAKISKAIYDEVAVETTNN